MVHSNPFLQVLLWALNRIHWKKFQSKHYPLILPEPLGGVDVLEACRFVASE
jgi:hypothetical protein